MFCSAMEKPKVAAEMPSSTVIGGMKRPRLCRRPMQIEMMRPLRTMSRTMDLFSVSGGTRGLDRTRPLHRLRRDKARRLVERLRRRHQAEILDARAQVGRAHRFHDLRVQLLERGPRGAGGREEAVPAGGFEARQRLGDRG